MIKFAIPTKNNLVDDHFGHCEYYTIFSIDDKKEIVGEEIYEAPQGCGCKSDVAMVLKEKGVTTMLAGNLGQGALNKIVAAGIDVYRGCKGDVKFVAGQFLSGELTDSGLTCSHHHEDGNDYSCDHHHNQGFTLIR